MLVLKVKNKRSKLIVRLYFKSGALSPTGGTNYFKKNYQQRVS